MSEINNEVPEQNIQNQVTEVNPSPAYRDPEFPPKDNKKKKIIIICVLAVLLIGVIVGIVSCNNSRNSSNSSYDSYVVYDPYVSAVKNATNSNYGITYGKAFDSFFSNTKWSSFTATSGEHVVEFSGSCYYDGSPATVEVQFVVDMEEGTMQVYYMSINDVSLNRLEMAAIVQKVFQSY